ncbi:MAG: DUF4399 domain-containing protein [Verrucomicrobiota bacterium]
MTTKTTVSAFLTIGILALVAGWLVAQDEHKHETPPEGFPKNPSPEGAEVYIISPKDGDTVPKTFTVQFGLKGMGIAPAGIAFPNSGHHHLLVDAPGEPDHNLPLPADDNHLHYGAGQTETELTLEPGKHTLQLVLGDLNHVPHDPPVVSKTITITVEDN